MSFLVARLDVLNLMFLVIFVPLYSVFTFTVGAHKQEVTVHSSALAGLSPSLNSLMNGEMIEAKTRHVVWSHVDVDTFARLCEFAYLRNYTPPTSRLISGETPPVEQPAGAAKATKTAKRKKKRLSVTDWDAWGARAATEPAFAPESEPEPMPAPDPPPKDLCDNPEIPYKERSVWTRHLRDAFSRSSVVPSLQSGNLDCPFTPPKNTGPWEDFSPIFLEQARLYVLADEYGVDSLCQLVLSKLYQTMKSFKLYDTGVNGIIELVRFVYMNTPPNSEKKVDAMRNLVTRYVVSILGQIGENECFQELLAEGGPFVCDLWHTIWSAEENEFDGSVE